MSCPAAVSFFVHSAPDRSNNLIGRKLENTMYRVFIPNLNRWIENIPVTEALVYKEEGYRVERMS